ncbi:ATP-binding cassette, subfamily F, member 3 [Syntrophus gentianae]|uniref:ATP-binding cassette, subfamily F, member 3 n=1 Tax=Syntrophus gentianae TaxID=43775 RepID=A0A1H7WSC7_9BACT|nr:ABC-F family ATP-binding cassette domain-containing protein [Syntrophus gentianae]SEM24155.1 ATP-binding cassette, subfamily F, member 3 [Syntrophus gentianae]
MISLNNISLAFGERVIFDGVNWTLVPRSRVGLVGDNGAGKTTLLRAIAGSQELDGGSIDILDRKNTTLGYLPQDLIELESLHILDFLKKRSGLSDLETTLKNCEEQVSLCPPDSPDHEAFLKTYEKAMAAFQAKDGYAFEARARQVLHGFGFRDSDFAKNCLEFSGGWKMRILLAVILLARPDIMLLDEPTNHLDTESMEWLESYLRDYPGTLITVSHDRTFLDKITTVTAELSQGKVTLYKGNYSFYLAEKEKRRLALLKELESQKAEIRKIQEFVERFRYKATKAAQVQSRIKMLEKMELVRAEGAGKTVRISFPSCPSSGRDVISVRGLSKAYGENEVFSDLNFTITRGEKVALVGMNGAGKSTLSRLLSRVEDPSAGEVRFGLHVKLSFFSQESAENLNYDRTVLEDVNNVSSRCNDQEKRNLLGAFLFSGDDIHKPVAVLSGGEKSRLALLKILMQDANLLILDEPTNHLDMKTRDIFQEALLEYAGTVILVSHDRYFLDRLVNRVIEIRDGQAFEYKGNYSYFIVKREEALGNIGTPPSAAKGSVLSDNGREGKLQRKEMRRLEAEERNRRSKIRSALKKELSTLEKSITSLEEKKGTLEATLCTPEIYRNPEQLKTLQQDLHGINRDLQQSYTDWDDLTEKMEAMENEAGEGIFPPPA